MNKQQPAVPSLASMLFTFTKFFQKNCLFLSLFHKHTHTHTHRQPQKQSIILFNYLQSIVPNTPEKDYLYLSRDYSRQVHVHSNVIFKCHLK